MVNLGVVSKHKVKIERKKTISTLLGRNKWSGDTCAKYLKETKEYKCYTIK